MNSPYMAFFAKGLATRGFRAARSEYPYMASQRVAGKQKPPDREPVPQTTCLRVVEMLRNDSPTGKNCRLPP
jgi:predicted alpha/beta-hydrolase family hydrolase